MKSQRKMIIIVLVAIIAVFGLLLFRLKNLADQPGRHDNFAKCLSEKEVRMYGAY